jgi:hypothetical protein
MLGNGPAEQGGVGRLLEDPEFLEIETAVAARGQQEMTVQQNLIFNKYLFYIFI